MKTDLTLTLTQGSMKTSTKKRNKRKEQSLNEKAKPVDVILRTGDGSSSFSSVISESEVPVDYYNNKDCLNKNPREEDSARALRKQVRFHSQHTVILHITREDYTEKRLEKCFFPKSIVQENVQQAEKQAKKLQRRVKTVTGMYCLDSEEDDLRGLEHMSGNGRARRAMHMEMAKKVVLNNQNKMDPEEYERVTSAARDQALMRGALYGKKEINIPAPMQRSRSGRFVSVETAVLMHHLATNNNINNHDVVVEDDHDNDDDVSIISCRSTASMRSKSSRKSTNSTNSANRRRRRKPSRRSKGWRV